MCKDERLLSFQAKLGWDCVCTWCSSCKTARSSWHRQAKQRSDYRNCCFWQSRQPARTSAERQEKMLLDEKESHHDMVLSFLNVFLKYQSSANLLLWLAVDHMMTPSCSCCTRYYLHQVRNRTSRWRQRLEDRSNMNPESRGLLTAPVNTRRATNVHGHGAKSWLVWLSLHVPASTSGGRGLTDHSWSWPKGCHLC